MMRIKQNNSHVVELATNNPKQSLVLSEFEFFGTCIKCLVQLCSSRFKYNGTIFFDNFSEFVSSLEEMNSNLTGYAKLTENYKEHYLKLELNNLGHVIVSAFFCEYSEHSQSINIEFKTDQTCLPAFISDLKKVSS